MSDKALTRIEKVLGKLARQQEEICAELGALRERIDGLAPGGEGSASREEVIRFLDQFRAGEALGEASTGAWLAVSTTGCLRGGLRTIQMREGAHARLLADRIKELGGSPSFEIPEPIHAAAMADAGNAEKSDAQKVRDFVQRFGDADKALAPIFSLADRLDGDPETQTLLRTIAQDERATIEFLNEACALLDA